MSYVAALSFASREGPGLSRQLLNVCRRLPTPADPCWRLLTLACRWSQCCCRHETLSYYGMLFFCFCFLFLGVGGKKNKTLNYPKLTQMTVLRWFSIRQTVRMQNLCMSKKIVESTYVGFFRDKNIFKKKYFKRSETHQNDCLVII